MVVSRAMGSAATSRIETRKALVISPEICAEVSPTTRLMNSVTATATEGKITREGGIGINTALAPLEAVLLSLVRRRRA